MALFFHFINLYLFLLFFEVILLNFSVHYFTTWEGEPILRKRSNLDFFFFQISILATVHLYLHSKLFFIS